jgi:hypothetical protein
MRYLHWRHPEWIAVALSALAWVLSANATLRGGGMLRMSAVPERQVVAVIGRGLSGAAIMSVAMMIPMALPTARHLALTSRWSRRQRTLSLFLIAYTGLWVTLLAPFYSATAWRGPSPTGRAAVAGAFLLIAAVWTRTGFAIRAVRRCHLLRLLPINGIRADVACLRAGASFAANCCVACWPAMLALALLPRLQFGFMLLVSALVAADLWAARRELVKIQTPLGFAVLGLALFIQ